MKMFLDTSTATCILRLDDHEYCWEADRQLAEGLLAFLRDKICEELANTAATPQPDATPTDSAPQDASNSHSGPTSHNTPKDPADPFSHLSEITFFSGPGSFTGLRIGAAVVNTLAHELQIPLYKHNGEQVPLIIPDYGRPANISAPRK